MRRYLLDSNTAADLIAKRDRCPFGCATFDFAVGKSELVSRYWRSFTTGLLDDLRDRGLEKDVAVVVWGEFGRTPVISKQLGRDHWPRVAAAVLAGGGMQMGQVIGSTDRLGGEATSRPATFGEVFATLYHHLGIDVDRATLTDLNGRPQYLVDRQSRPLAELI